MDSITMSGKKGMNISKAYSEDLFFRTNQFIQELVVDREVWRAAVHGVTKVGHDRATELN